VEDIKKLYDLFYSPILTPYNLLENAKLPNYSYVNYYMGENGLIAEMECEMEITRKHVVFYYHFDKDDKLIEVYMEEDGNKNKVFNRNVEKDYQLSKILSKRNEKSKDLEDVI